MTGGEGMKNRHYPIMLGMNPKTKQGIGIKSKLGSGYDLYILDEDLTDTHRQVLWGCRNNPL